MRTRSKSRQSSDGRLPAITAVDDQEERYVAALLGGTMSDYSIQRDGNDLTLSMRGQITYEISPEIKRDIEAHFEQGTIATVRVDMSGASFLDSHGIGILVMLHKLTSGPDMEMIIVNPSQEAVKILDLVGLLAIFTVQA